MLVRRWWLLCGVVLVGVVALNGVVNGVVDAKAAPAPRAVCVRGGATAIDGVSGRALVCVQTKARGLRWRFQQAAVTTTTTTTVSTTVSTTVPGVVAPVVTCATGGACVVGDTGPGGGKVFYVSDTNFTSTGSDCNTTCRYLEAAPADQSTGIVWATNTPKCYVEAGGDNSNNNDCQLFSIYSPLDTPNQAASRTAATAIGAGMANTNQIHSRLTSAGGADTSTYAAGIAYAYANNGKSDWHLPSKDELNQMCNYAWNLTVSNTTTTCTGMSGSIRTGFATGFYWSSSEFSAPRAWLQDFSNGTQHTNAKTNNRRVRPVRAFG